MLWWGTVYAKERGRGESVVCQWWRELTGCTEKQLGGDGKEGMDMVGGLRGLTLNLISQHCGTQGRRQRTLDVLGSSESQDCVTAGVGAGWDPAGPRGGLCSSIKLDPAGSDPKLHVTCSPVFREWEEDGNHGLC